MTFAVYTYATQNFSGGQIIGENGQKSAFFDFQLLLLITLWSGVRVPADPPL
jgi:hypothetical protein